MSQMLKPSSVNSRAGTDFESGQGSHGPIVNVQVTEKRKQARKRKAKIRQDYIAWPLKWEKGRKMAAMEQWTRRFLSWDLDKSDVKIACALSYLFNSENGRCFAKRQEIANFAGVSVGTCRNALTRLEQARLILRRRETIRGKQMTVIYPAMPEYNPA
ncbi:winged helix-turn-helix domain-containing protein [Microvirga sesbaniae]|uniref:winged helix-turn-helix domain-containing protein n=1 Tax=Microvirga sesbaniae TaxID=681392 RepID=UPI0021CA1C24|nr:winged helix-turn-helix domain-containing protein [Microvirga sp. HBU67692]